MNDSLATTPADGAAPITSLAARYYTDPAIFAAERTGLLTRSWQFAGHASRLQQAGDYFTFALAGESLFCIRGRDGTIRTFYNVCRHRAHQLVTGSGRARVLVCPYHAWSYELTGQLRAAPNSADVPGFERTGISLTAVRTELFLGFIFVNLDPQARPMDDWFPDARRQLTEWVPHFDALRPLEWLEIPERCNWKVAVENYSECYHCALNHPTFATGVVKPETYDIRPQGYCLRHTTECQNLDAMRYQIHPGKAHWDEYSSWFLWPMFAFQVYPGNVLNTYHWRATAVDRVIVWRGWYTFDGADEPAIHALAAQDRATTVAEDIQLVESVQRGLTSRGYVPGPLVLNPAGGVNSEHSIQLLQQWMRTAVD